MADDGIRTLLLAIFPSAREHLRDVLFRDQATVTRAPRR
jgi:hypothetical protein